MYVNCKIRSLIIYGILLLLLFSLFYYTGRYYRERNLLFYSEDNWKIAMDKNAFPNCFGTKLYIQTFDSLRDSMESKKVLMTKIDNIMNNEKIKLQRRGQYVSGKEKERINKTLNYKEEP